MRVVIAEDSVLLREGLAKLLENEGFEVVGRAGDAEELLLKVRSYEPDVAVVDVRMPPTHTDEGARAAVTIRERHPEVGVLLLSQVVEATFALRLFSESPAGFGYLLKDRIVDIDDFVDALRRVARGGTAMDPVVVSELLGRTRPDDPLLLLTARERGVLELMAEGRSNAGIGHKLFLSPKTVETHVHAIFTKLEPRPRLVAGWSTTCVRSTEAGGDRSRLDRGGKAAAPRDYPRAFTDLVAGRQARCLRSRPWTRRRDPDRVCDIGARRARDHARLRCQRTTGMVAGRAVDRIRASARRSQAQLVTALRRPTEREVPAPCPIHWSRRPLPRLSTHGWVSTPRL